MPHELLLELALDSTGSVVGDGVRDRSADAPAPPPRPSWRFRPTGAGPSANCRPSAASSAVTGGEDSGERGDVDGSKRGAGTRATGEPIRRAAGVGDDDGLGPGLAVAFDVDGCGLGVAWVSVSWGRLGDAVGESYGRGTFSAPLRSRLTIESTCAARSVVGGGDGEAVS